MDSLSKDEWRQILSETLADQLQAILEYVRIIPDIVHRLDRMEADLQSVKSTVEMHEYDLRRIYAKLA